MSEGGDIAELLGSVVRATALEGGRGVAGGGMDVAKETRAGGAEAQADETRGTEEGGWEDDNPSLVGVPRIVSSLAASCTRS